MVILCLQQEYHRLFFYRGANTGTGGTLTAGTNLTNPKKSLCHCNAVNLCSVACLPQIPWHPDLTLATAWAVPLLIRAAIPGKIAHITPSAHCSNAAGLQAIPRSSSASIHWKNGPGSSELAKVEGTPPKSYAWLIQPKRHKLNIWSAFYYLLVEKVVFSELCFILFLFILSHNYWFSNISHCNFLHKVREIRRWSVLCLLSFCYTINIMPLIKFWMV